MSASSDAKVQNAIETSREMHMFMLAPDGIKSDTGEPAPEMEGNAERLKRRLFKFYRFCGRICIVDTNMHSTKT